MYAEISSFVTSIQEFIRNANLAICLIVFMAGFSAFTLFGLLRKSPHKNRRKLRAGRVFFWYQLALGVAMTIYVVLNFKI